MGALAWLLSAPPEFPVDRQRAAAWFHSALLVGAAASRSAPNSPSDQLSARVLRRRLLEPLAGSSIRRRERPLALFLLSSFHLARYRGLLSRLGLRYRGVL
jgi:hypothetical protein